MTEKDDIDLQVFLPYLLNQAAETSSLTFQQVYKDRYGMLRAEWRTLFHLGIHGPLTAKDICSRTKMHKTKISRAVQKLEDRRFLSRQTNENDRRFEVLTLTPVGHAAYRDLRQIAKAYETKLLAGFTRVETDALRQMLLRLSGNNAAKT